LHETESQLNGKFSLFESGCRHDSMECASKSNNASSNKRELFNIEAEIRKQEFNGK
jgi:hypothetical protein